MSNRLMTCHSASTEWGATRIGIIYQFWDLKASSRFELMLKTTTFDVVLVIALCLGMICWEHGVSGEKSNEPRMKRLLLVVPASHHHVVLLREIAVGILEEFPACFEVELAVPGRYKALAEGIRGLEVIGLPEVAGNQETATQDPCQHINTSTTLAEIRRTGFECQYDPLEKIILSGPRPDFLVIDLFNDAAVALAEKYGIDFAIVARWGGRWTQLGEHFWLPHPWKGGHLHEMRAVTNRLDNIISYLTTGLPNIVAAEATIKAAKIQRDLNPGLDPLDSWKGHLVLCLGMAGFHPPRSLPSNVKLIGFVSPKPEDPATLLRSPGHQAFDR